MTCTCEPDCTLRRLLIDKQTALKEMMALNYTRPGTLEMALVRVKAARRDYEAHTENPVATADTA